MSLAPSLKSRLKRLEAASSPVADRAAQMRALREQRLSMSPAEQAAAHAQRLALGIAALSAPDEPHGTVERAVQGMRRRWAARHIAGPSINTTNEAI